MTEFIINLIVNTFNNNPVIATLIISILPIFELRGALPFAMSTSIWGSLALSPIQAFLISIFGTTIIIPIIALLFNPIIKGLKKTRLFRRLATKFENSLKNKANTITTKSQVSSQYADNTQPDNDTFSNIDNNNNANISSTLTRISNNKIYVNDNINTDIDNINTKSNVINSTKIKNNLNKKSLSNNFKKILGVMMFVAVPLPLTGVYSGTCIAVMLGLNFYEILLSVGLGNLIAGLIVLAISTIFKSNTLIVIYIFLILLLLILFVGFIKKLIRLRKVKKSINTK